LAFFQQRNENSHSVFGKTIIIDRLEGFCLLKNLVVFSIWIYKKLKVLKRLGIKIIVSSSGTPPFPSVLKP
jgi:hypothetical protein